MIGLAHAASRRRPFMRRLITTLVLALVLPASAHAAVRVSAFYYPWYGNLARDGAFQHWGQHGHAPPTDIAAAYYPLRGLYSSSDWLVTSEQMQDMREAGIDEGAVSWWGQGSPEDTRLPEGGAGARAGGGPRRPPGSRGGAGPPPRRGSPARSTWSGTGAAPSRARSQTSPTCAR